MLKTKLTGIILGVVLLLSLSLRLYQLNILPAGLHFDEAQAGYNAFLIGETGKSINNISWPIYIDAWGDFRPAAVVYASLLPVKLLGLSPFTTRLPTALASIGVIFLVFLLSNEFFKNKKIALFASFLAATQGYAFVTSRGTLEGIIECFFILAALFLLILSFKRKSLLFLIPIYPLLVLGYFSYMTSRVMVPLMWVPSVLICFWHFRPAKKYLLLGILPFVVYMLFPWLFFWSSPIGSARFNQVSVFSYPESARVLKEQITEEGGKSPVLVTRLFHNKAVSYVYDIGSRYLTFFSPNPIVFEMRQPDRHFVPNLAPISALEYLGFLLALVVVLTKKLRPLAYLPLLLLLLAPIPSSLTVEAFPNFSRVVYMFPYFPIVAAFGWVFFLRRFGRSLKLVVYAGMCLIFLWQFATNLRQYFIHESVHFDSITARSTEMKDLALFLKSQKDHGEKVILSERDGPYIYYLFYNRLPLNRISYATGDNYFGGKLKLDGMNFVIDCVSVNNLLQNNYTIMVAREDCKVPSWFTKVAEFRRSNSSLAAAAYKITQEDLILLKQLVKIDQVGLKSIAD